MEGEGIDFEQVLQLEDTYIYESWGREREGGRVGGQ